MLVVVISAHPLRDFDIHNVPTLTLSATQRTLPESRALSGIDVVSLRFRACDSRRSGRSVAHTWLKDYVAHRRKG